MYKNKMTHVYTYINICTYIYTHKNKTSLICARCAACDSPLSSTYPKVCDLLHMACIYMYIYIQKYTYIYILTRSRRAWPAQDAPLATAHC